MPGEIPHSPIAGKNVLFIGAGQDSDIPHYRVILNLGAHLFFADTESSGWRERLARTGFGTFIPFSFSYPLRSLGSAFAAQIEEMSKDPTMGIPKQFDAAFSIEDGYLVPAAYISTYLGLAFQPIEAVEAAEDKWLMRQCLHKAHVPSPRSAIVHSEEESNEAVADLGLPVIMKLSRGCHSVGIRKVSTLSEIATTFNEIHAIASDHNQHVLIEQYLTGPEVDVDFVLQDGKVLYSCVLDNWSVSPPYFEERGVELPSSCDLKLQEDLKSYVAECLRALGFKNGLFHTEARCTPDGPRLIEVNPRIGCGPMRDIHLAVWGVDLMEQLCLIALGLPIHLELPERPLLHCAGPGFPSPHSGVIVKSGWLDDAVAKLGKGQARAWGELYSEGTHVKGSREDSPSNLGFVIIGEKDRDSCRAAVNQWIEYVKVPVRPDQGSWTPNFGLKMP